MKDDIVIYIVSSSSGERKEIVVSVCQEQNELDGFQKIYMLQIFCVVRFFFVKNQPRRKKRMFSFSVTAEKNGIQQKKLA